MIGGVSPRVGVQVDETEDESVHEKCDALGGVRGQEVWRYEI